jgi:hypothetical protein
MGYVVTGMPSKPYRVRTGNDQTNDQIPPRAYHAQDARRVGGGISPRRRYSWHWPLMA